MLNDMIRWKKKGMKTPLDNRPNPPKSYAKYYAAYKCLSFSKNMNGNIPFSEITNYMDFYRIRNTEKFIRIMYSLDTAHNRAGKG